MLQRMCLAVLCVGLVWPVASANAKTDPTLVGWWWFNEGSGTTAHDSSMYGNDGTLMNGPQWVAGYFGNALKFDGTDDYVTVPHNESLCVSTGVSVMAWVNMPRYEFPGGGYQGIISKGNAPRSYSLYTTSSGVMHFSIGPSGGYVGTTSSSTVPLNQWVHICAMVRDGVHYYYINGVAAGSGGSGTALPGTTSTANVLIGDTEEASREYGGMMDDVRIYNRSMTADEILKIMTGDDLVTGAATSPVPDDGQTDVPQDVVLTWAAGETAATHDVYFSDTFDDVNNASRANPKGVLISQGQTGLTCDPDGLLEFGKTYYWRVDEVNAAPDYTVFKGAVWSFTVEPFSYPVRNVTATASSQSRADTGAQNTVNGSGLNANDQHSMELADMWMSSNTKPHWIQYQFDKVYKLDQMWVWNANQIVEMFVGFGAKDVTIEYSIDGQTWTSLDGSHEFARATADAAYTANTVVDFGGVNAKFVKLTINSNWGGVAQQVSLSEVRFFYVPVQAREPQPANAATDVALTASMDWRPGREATSHKVFFGTDGDAVAAGTAPANTVTGHGFTPASMTFGTKYFWKVDEVGDAGTYEGDVWSFTSQEFAFIEDFEGYTDDEGNRIYEYWVDGMTDGMSGSTVGYMTAPFAEQAIVHRGAQSMPMAYDNTKAPYYSEASMVFDPAQNCTGSGATELCVWTRGYPALATTAVAETGGKMSLTGAGADIWNNSDEFTYAYKTLTGDGSLIARVTSNGTGTNTWAKGGVMIRDTVNGGSKHAMMVMTGSGGNGASFQYRATTNGTSGNADSTSVVAPPYWVKIDRQGSTFTGYISADGKTWSLVGQTVIEMADPVLIGIAVTSHVAGVDRTFQFEGITATGAVTGNWQGAAINAARYNDAAPMYLTVTDSAGKSATATSNTAATVAEWTRWTIPMSSLNGVNLSKVKKLTIGVGAKGATTGGSGMVFIDDIGYGKSASQQ